MARTPDTREASGTVLAPTEDTALSLDPSAAPLLRKVVPEIDEKPTTKAQQIITGVFVFAPMLALVAAIPFFWGWGLNWHDIVIGAVFYWVSGLGITVGYHRYFTHSSFKAKSGLRVALAIAGTLAMGGPVVPWVADHRRHHKYSDKEGDPPSPWKYGDDAKALFKGLLWAHMVWLFDPNQTSQEKFAPDLIADRKIRIVDAWFPGIVAFPLIAPPGIGGFWAPPGGLSPRGRHRGVLPGQPCPHHAAAPRDLVDQLDLSHLGQHRLDVPRPVGERRLAGHRLLRRVLAQPAPRRPDVRQARCAQGTDRPVRPGDPVVREARLGLRRALAGRGAAERQARGRRDAQLRQHDEA